MEAMCTCKAEGFFWLPSFQDGNCIRSCEAVASSCGVHDLHKRACRASLRNRVSRQELLLPYILALGVWHIRGACFWLTPHLLHFED